MRWFSSVVVLVSMIASAEAALTSVNNFGSNPGALDMFEYVPEGLPDGSPLVVVLHGCTQQASGMLPAGWNTLADAYKFAVVYAQQRSSNQNLSCFSWYSAGDIGRDMGEARSIIEMVDNEIATRQVDPKRVYVTGLSAGAAMTAVMLAAYPDRFRAGSIMAGLPYKCATSISDTSSCQNPRTPQQWGDLVRGAYPAFSGPYPRVQIWHGSSDAVVPTANSTELVKQWTDVWGIDQTADATDMISNTTRTQHTSNGKVVVELNLVSGMGHAIAFGSDPLGTCPASAGSYFSDQQICSTLRAAQFFGLLGGSGDPGTGDGDGSGSDGPDASGGDEAHDGGLGCNAGRAGGTPIIALALLALARGRKRRSIEHGQRDAMK
jgi:poly(hydroxyalkanoate) depolymerase family esterase